MPAGASSSRPVLPRVPVSRRIVRRLRASGGFSKIFMTSVAAIAIAMTALYLYMEHVEERKLSAAGEANAVRFAERLENSIESLRIDVSLISGTPSLHQYIATGGEAVRKDVEQTFRAAMGTWAAFAQMRYIDADGQERIRVDRIGADLRTLPVEELQFKGDRGYFKSTLGLAKGSLFISRIDLNVERGQIEVPWKPMLRVGSPVFHADGSRAGIFIINILADYVLTTLDDRDHDGLNDTNLMLLSEDGSWLSGAPAEKLWGFMFPGRTTFSAENREAWRAVTGANQGTFWQENDRYSFATVYPDGASRTRFDDGQAPLVIFSPVSFWKVVDSAPRVTTPLYARPNWWAMFAFLVLVAAGLSLAIGRTVARRREAENRERNTIARSKEVLNNTSVAICICDLDGKVVFANDQYCQVAHKSISSLSGAPETLFTNGLAAATEDQAKKRARYFGNAESMAVDVDVHAAAGGDEKDFLLSWFPLFDVDGKADARCFVGVDVTRMKGVERSLEKATQEAVEASLAKSRFVANMSHELRTPLNAIIGYAELLAEEAEDEGLEQYRQDTQRILDAGSHLLSLINDILDLSKIEAGQMEAHVESFQLKEVLRSVISSANPLMDKNDNAFEIDVEDDAVLMRSDSTRLRQILLNLLSNAAKFTKQGTVTLSCRSEDAGRTLVFNVVDTGIGMTAEQLDKIFEEFAQADSSISKRFQGTGLGLAICKRLAEMLGGTIVATSEEGVGSSFTLTIPRDMAGEGAAGLLAIANASSEDAAKNLPAVSVLIIDDDPNARELLARHIISQGMQVTTAASGEEGLMRARMLKPDVITLDVFMIGLNGFDVLTQLKMDPALKDIPVIMCTISDREDAFISLGAVEFLTKPINRQEYVNAILRHTRNKDDATILIVDDMAENREVMTRYLDGMNCRIVEAENGLDALEKLDSLDRLDCVLLDLMMPVMDGFRFLEAFRERDTYRDTPVFVITAKTLTDEERAQLTSMAQSVQERANQSFEMLLEDLRNQIGRGIASAA